MPGLGHPDPTWATLYRAGGWSALVYVLLVVVPVVLVFVAPVPPTEGAALLEYIAAHKVVYLVELVCFVGLAVPALVVFGAVAVAVKDVNKSIAAIGGLFGIASEVIALALGSSPQSLHGELVVLSNAYRDVAGDAERASLTSAADALIAATNAVSWAGILDSGRHRVVVLDHAHGGLLRTGGRNPRDAHRCGGNPCPRRCGR